MDDVGVVYLAHRSAGAKAVERFLASYTAHPAGADHELVVLLKGSPEFASVLASAPPHRTLVVPDEGLDIGSYLFAAQTLEHRFVCFLNSHSVLASDDWLAKLSGPVTEGAAALAGASGSYASLRSLSLYRLGLPSPYARVFPGRATTERELLRLELAQAPASPRARWSAGRRRLEDVLVLAQTLRGFGAFPAPHLRTNAFLLARETFLLTARQPRGKFDAWRFESGRRSLSAVAGPAVVVGADGSAYAPEDWPHSGTFWQDEQENLLVADNQTRLYDEGDAGRRELLARLAWGPDARAAPSR